MELIANALQQVCLAVYTVLSEIVTIKQPNSLWERSLIHTCQNLANAMFCSCLLVCNSNTVAGGEYVYGDSLNKVKVNKEASRSLSLCWWYGKVTTDTDTTHHKAIHLFQMVIIQFSMTTEHADGVNEPLVSGHTKLQ